MLTEPVATAAPVPSKLSEKVAPGSVNVEPASTVTVASPVKVMTGASISSGTTVTVRVTESATFPAASV